MAIDLTGKSFNINQDIIEKGQSIDLNFSVVNNGTNEVGPFTFDIVISQDEEISSDDLRIGYYEIVNGLAAGGDSGVKSFRYKTPSASHPFWNSDSDSYTVGIRLDPDLEYFESNEGNNSNVGLGIDYDQVQVEEFGLSDLKGSFISLGNPEITPGRKLDLSFTVENDSTEIANPFSVDIYLSSSEDLSGDDAVKVGTYDIRNSLAGGEDTGVKSFSYKTPDLGHPLWEKGDGEYYLVLDIDSKEEVSETNENNNSGQGEGLDYAGFNVTGLNSAADLVVTSFKAPENAKAGDTVTLEYEITNQGGSSADLFGAGFYLFTEEYKDSNDNLNVEDVPEVYFFQGDRAASAISLDAGESTGMMTVDVTLPETWGGYSGNGDYYLGVEADAYDDVVESNDTNNSLTGEMVDFQKVALEAPNLDTVDLVGTHFEVVQDQILPGEQFDLGFTIENQGLGEADPFYFDLYLSQDENISAEEDFYLGRYDIRTGLGGGSDIGLKSSRYTAPEADDPFWSEGNGTYYAGMIIDPANDIAETDETNNSNVGEDLDYASTYANGLGELADLKTNGFQVTQNTINAGDTFDVTYDVFNEGEASADLFGVGFFLFTEDYLLNRDALSVEDIPQVYFWAGDREDAAISLEPATGTGSIAQGNGMTTELAMPTNWAGFAGGSGNYYIGFAADPYGDIIESDETNNSLTAPFVDYEQVYINVNDTLA